jgi:hypothetical protein
VRGAPWPSADLLAAPIMGVRRNREIVAEAAGLGARVPTARTGPAEAGPGPAPAPSPPPGGARKPGAPSAHPLLAALIGYRRAPVGLKGEDAIQADIVFRLDTGTLAGTWAITALPNWNEVRVRSSTKAEIAERPGLLPWHQEQVRLAKRQGGRANDMGRKKGAPDLWLLNWRLRAFGLLEVKAPSGRMSPEQDTWRDCCEEHDVNHAVVTSWHDALRALRVWGWL